jgi:hypothetical protein
MTDFTEGQTKKCHICGESYFEPEGKACVCWKCAECGEEFSDFDMLANVDLLLCLYCEDERLQAETKNESHETL